ncbi:MAG: hypothetical protein NDI69_15510 [Bacteriovoracaceae bacterium]|nr:hypothetical protein [Bacteriovoracaceae bacterium]
MKMKTKLLTMLSLGILFNPVMSKAVTHTFTSNTTISASQMNQNFTDVEAAIAGLNSGAIAEGANLYFTDARVRATLLTGYTAGSPSPISASDTFLQALGKLEAMINNSQGVAVQKSGDMMFGNLDMGANRVTNLAVPIMPTDAATKEYVDGLRYGLMTKWNDPNPVQCPMTGSVWFTPVLDPTELNNLSFNVGTGIFTIPADGVYEIFLDAPYTAVDMYSMLSSKLSIFDGTTTHAINLPNNGTAVKRFLQNDQVKLQLYCSNTYANSTITMNSDRFVFAVRKISY